jgi:aspartate/methionine/tyrosine aminotransferase
MQLAQRLRNIPGFSIDTVASAAGSDPDVLRLENLDTDLAPPEAAVQATRRAVGTDDANSYLPFTGSLALRETVSQHLKRLTGRGYDPLGEIVITCGGTEGMVDALLAATDPGDEVVLTDPTYAGMTNRVRLAGAVPRLVPFVVDKGHWRLDVDTLRRSVTGKTRALFLMSPSMPSGGVLSAADWSEVAALCSRHSLWLLYNAAMERILFDGLSVYHPVSHPDLRERTIIIGSVSKEYRMIGWRVGWVAGPAAIMADIAKAHIYNVVTATGIAQEGARAALLSPHSDLRTCVAEWERRRNTVVSQLKEYPVVVPDGGWSLLVDVGQLGTDSVKASRLLLEEAKIAATPMKHWGEKNGDQFIRFVYSNESVERLLTLGERMKRVFG